jgi:hypothetical protein
MTSSTTFVLGTAMMIVYDPFNNDTMIEKDGNQYNLTQNESHSI